MEAKKINLDEWGYYGEGGTATSYCNKLDGNLFLKLNKVGYPERLTLEEFLASKNFSDMGLPTPPVYDFVTDGERYGYTGARIKGKVSFTRTISQEPERLKEMALRFATLAKRLHQTKADKSRVKSCLEHYKEYLGDLSFLPSDAAGKVMQCLNEFQDAPNCLHGDFNPGNVITYEGRDYWIGINSCMSGEPYWDLATMYIIANCTPAKIVKERYHLTPAQFSDFFDAFKRHYFGNEWNSPEIALRIRNAAVVKCSALIKDNPVKASLYLPFIRGKKFLFRIRLAFCRVDG